MASPTILWISAHPSTTSLNYSLRALGIQWLRTQGFPVLESDLYQMNWNPVLDGSDLGIDPEEFNPTESIRSAYLNNRLPEDVRSEQAKVRAADGVVLQFPLWWYGVSAILKGWFDRVLHAGFAFGTDPSAGKRLRFESGPFRGKRALVITTLGDRPSAIGARGKSGQLDELLFPLLHGTLAYTGFDVLEPIAIASADHLLDHDLDMANAEIVRRLDSMFIEKPIPYRPQFTGEYTEQ